MLPEHILSEAVLFLHSGNCTITLALAVFEKHDGVPTYRSLNISDGLKNEFSQIANNYIAKVQESLISSDVSINKYSVSYKPNIQCIEYLDLSTDVLLEIANKIPNPAEIPLIGDKDGFVKKVRFYILLFYNGTQSAVFFRRYNQSKQLTRSNNLVIRLIGDRYERLTEPSFLFDEDFDAILFDNYIFILNSSNFKHIFRYYELLRTAAIEVLETIRTTIPIANFDSFKESCLNHPYKLEKLKNIANKAYLNQLTIGKIKNTINIFNLQIKIEKINGQEQLVFDKSYSWEILNLLDDDYLTSGFTGLKYEANSKREI